MCKDLRARGSMNIPAMPLNTFYFKNASALIASALMTHTCANVLGGRFIVCISLASLLLSFLLG